MAILLNLLLYCLLISSTSYAENIPSAISEKIDTERELIIQMLKKDPLIRKEMNLTDKEIESLFLDKKSIFQLNIFTSDINEIREARQISELVNRTGIYYVPVCTSKMKCNAMASFTLEGDKAQIMSVGEALYAKQIQMAKQKIQKIRNENPGKNIQFQMLTTPNHQLDFVYANNMESGEEYIFLQTDRDQEKLLSGRSGNVRIIKKINFDSTVQILEESYRLNKEAEEFLKENSTRNNPRLFDSEEKPHVIDRKENKKIILGHDKKSSGTILNMANSTISGPPIKKRIVKKKFIKKKNPDVTLFQLTSLITIIIFLILFFRYKRKHG